MNAGASSAAGLLAHSVEDVRWLHIDIARLLVDVLERFD
jgi:leucyl aminopeptidase